MDVVILFCRKSRYTVFEGTRLRGVKKLALWRRKNTDGFYFLGLRDLQFKTWYLNRVRLINWDHDPRKVKIERIH